MKMWSSASGTKGTWIWIWQIQMLGFGT